MNPSRKYDGTTSKDPKTNNLLHGSTWQGVILSPNIRNSIPDKYKKDGRKLYKHLCKNYGGKSYGNAYAIKDKFFNSHQYPEESISDWIARLEGLRNELYQTNEQSIQASDMIVKLLKGTNKEYTVVTQRESHTRNLSKLKLALQEAEILQKPNYNKPEKLLQFQKKEKHALTAEKMAISKMNVKAKRHLES